MGKLKLTPMGKTFSRFSLKTLHASPTTSAIRSAIHEKRLSAFSFLRCSPIGQDRSRCRRMRGSGDGGGPIGIPARRSFCVASNSTNPTLRLVPPLDGQHQLSIHTYQIGNGRELEARKEGMVPSTYMSIARYLMWHTCQHWFCHLTFEKQACTLGYLLTFHGQHHQHV